MSLTDCTHVQCFLFTTNGRNWIKSNAAMTVWSSSYLKIYRFWYQTKLNFSKHLLISQSLSLNFVSGFIVLLRFYSDTIFDYVNIFTLRQNWCSSCVSVPTCLILFFSSLSQSRNIDLSVTIGSKILYHCNRKFLCISNFRKSMPNVKTKWQSRSQLISINIQFWDSLECFSRHGNVSVGRSHLIMGLWSCLFEI